MISSSSGRARAKAFSCNTATWPSMMTAKSSSVGRPLRSRREGGGGVATASDALGDGRPATRAGGSLWLIAALSVAVGLYGLSYLVGRPAPPGPATNAARYPWLAIHAISAGAALLI